MRGGDGVVGCLPFFGFRWEILLRKTIAIFRGKCVCEGGTIRRESYFSFREQ